MTEKKSRDLVPVLGRDLVPVLKSHDLLPVLGRGLAASRFARIGASPFADLATGLKLPNPLGETIERMRELGERIDAWAAKFREAEPLFAVAFGWTPRDSEKLYIDELDRWINEARDELDRREAERAQRDEADAQARRDLDEIKTLLAALRSSDEKTGTTSPPAGVTEKHVEVRNIASGNIDSPNVWRAGKVSVRAMARLIRDQKAEEADKLRVRVTTDDDGREGPEEAVGWGLRYIEQLLRAALKVRPWTAEELDRRPPD